MSKINVLDKHVAELIAAGEIVDRPCSVVKELLENSIDAGATRIVVEIKNGGNTFIRVMDNGCGIEKEDISKAFLRHATSKISNENDLEKISTFGFRGEALASIAAVSHTKILTRTSDSFIGYCCEATDCEIGDVYEVGCPKGTSIFVEDLFYNTPARQKFMKKDVSEGNAVSQIIDKIALSHPEIQFRFIRDGATKLETRGTGDLIFAIEDVMGKEFSKNLIKIDYIPFDNSKYRVNGYVTKPSFCKTSRTYQNFFINTRFVKTSTAMVALEEAFKGSVMVGKYPGCVLNIDIPPENVDVNVHPAKMEVRFSNEKEIFDLVYFGIKTALNEKDSSALFEESEKINNNLWSTNYSENKKNSSEENFKQTSFQLFSKPIDAGIINDDFASDKKEEIRNSDSFTPFRTDGDIIHTVQYMVSKTTNDTEERKSNLSRESNQVSDFSNSIPEDDSSFGELKYIGELFKTYILLESPNELIFVDKHAAHERVIYNKLKARTKAFDCQYLVVPVTINLSEEMSEALIENNDEMERLGIIAEEFGKGTVIVRSLPFWLEPIDAEGVISEIADSIIKCKHDITPDKLDKLYATLACRAAIKANDKNYQPELETIVDILLNDKDVKYCPHGRPVSTIITKSKLEKMFGRIQ